jgi:hypothetical protein
MNMALKDQHAFKEIRPFLGRFIHFRVILNYNRRTKGKKRLYALLLLSMRKSVSHVPHQLRYQKDSYTTIGDVVRCRA